jgi:serine phosphatase RsbU (regulator of sigma subunit)
VFTPAGELKSVYGAVDWATSGVGDPETWSPALRQAVDLIWHTRYPATLFWGPQFVLLYNEAYVGLIGDKHPAALGTGAQDVFPEAWDVIGPLMQGVLDGIGATYTEDQLVPLVRYGFLEDCYFTYSYSPVHGLDRQVEGVICIASETTPQVLSRRRLELLSHLQSQLGAADDREQVSVVLADIGRAAHLDLPQLEYRPSVRSASTTTGPATRLPRAPQQQVFADKPLVEVTGAGTVVWCPLGVWDDEDDGPVLVVALNERLAPAPDYLTFVGLVGGAVSQALDRIELLEAERKVAVGERHMSEALQRSLLTAPAHKDDLRIAVRYRPAADTAQVGGDWYDSFVVRDGGYALTVGDVSGHDRDSAASMAQVRNLLRGIAFTLQEPPAAVMTSLDEAMEGLGLATTATAVLARLDPAEDGPAGRQVMVWTNAGHPPPVLINPDGRVRLLSTRADTMLGVDPKTRRRDHRVALDPGSTVVFYTDGLVERRTMPLHLGLEWLTRRLAGYGHLGVEELAEHVMADLPPEIEDDVALMVLRVDGGRPG